MPLASTVRSLRRWTVYVPALLVLLAGVVVLVFRDASASPGRPDTPAPVDYIDITKVPPAAPTVHSLPGASTGRWRSVCGRNMQGHHNADNVVSFPDQPGAAHHVHDYVGNTSTDAYSTNRSLLAAQTTCRDGDRSAYSWPVLRLRDQRGDPATEDLADDNRGRIVVPASVLIEYRGNRASNVVAMPEFLRAGSGNAHGRSEGGLNTQHVQWTCSGERDRVTQRYPRCPAGQRVVRIFDLPSCWDGKTTVPPTDLVFPDAAGTCPPGAFAVPQLHEEISYDVPRHARYAIDTFPSEGHSPLTDHADYIEVMPPALMAHIVDCINHGRHC